MQTSCDARLAALEAKVSAQEATLDGMVGALSDLLAAHAVLHNDVRQFSLLAEYRDGNQEKAKSGGTDRTPASYFASRSDLFARLIEEAAGSLVFENYWRRSMFWRREERERNSLRLLREAVAKKSSE